MRSEYKGQFQGVQKKRSLNYTKSSPLLLMGKQSKYLVVVVAKTAAKTSSQKHKQAADSILKIMEYFQVFRSEAILKKNKKNN